MRRVAIRWVGAAVVVLALLVPASLSFGASTRYVPEVPSWLPEFLAHPPGLPAPPAEAVPALDTAIDGLQARKGTLRVEFHASGTAVGFECVLDDRGPEACASPQVYHGLEPGRHWFAVVATGAEATDLSPAETHFWLPKPKPRHKRH